MRSIMHKIYGFMQASIEKLAFMTFEMRPIRHKIYELLQASIEKEAFTDIQNETYEA